MRTFLRLDKKRNPGFSFLCQTIVSGILLNYYYYFFNWAFFELRSGPLDFFWV